MTTYGECLDDIAAALSRAQTALRTPPPDGITDYAAVAIARTQLYRALEQQIVIIAGGDGGDFAQAVRRATALTFPHLPMPPPSTGVVAVAFRTAADASRTAGDVLTTHFNPAGRPRTSEGWAITAGVDQDRNLAQLAQLVRAANDIDRRLAEWLRYGYEHGSQQPVVQTAAADAEYTAAARSPRNDDSVEPGNLHQLRAAPLTDTAERWTTITTPAEAVAAVDAARAWLVQNRGRLTSADLNLLTRTGLALSYEVEYLVATTIDPNAPSTKTLNARWLRAARAAEGLRSLHRPETGVGPTVLAAAETWIRDQLRPDRKWRPAEHMRTSPDLTAWREAARSLAARMPDLATLVHRGAQDALQRGELLEPQGFRREHSRVVAKPQWGVARADAGRAAELLTATRQLREHSIRLARAAGTTPLPGLHEAATRYYNARQRVRDDLHRIAATEPVDASITHSRRSAARRDVAPQQRPVAPQQRPPVSPPQVEPPRPEQHRVDPPHPQAPPPSRGL